MAISGDGLTIAFQAAERGFSLLHLLADSVDPDGDGFGSDEDNCTQTSNCSQIDSDHDDYGNACDADYNNDGIVGGPDFIAFLRCFGHGDTDPEWVTHSCQHVDMDGDGAVGGAEFDLVRLHFGDRPGPSYVDK